MLGHDLVPRLQSHHQVIMPTRTDDYITTAGPISETLTQGKVDPKMCVVFGEVGMPKSETLNLRVSPEFKRRLAEEAKKEKRSVTNYIEA